MPADREQQRLFVVTQLPAEAQAWVLRNYNEPGLKDSLSDGGWYAAAVRKAQGDPPAWPADPTVFFADGSPALERT